MTDTPILPDDPRDCCRAASRIMIRDTFEDSLAEVADALQIVFACMTDDANEIPAEPLRNLLNRATDAMQTFKEQLATVHKIVRHGAGDNREMDQRLAERAKALDEGREPPYEPTGYEVRGAVIASEAAGKPISEDEAIALLRAHGTREAA